MIITYLRVKETKTFGQFLGLFLFIKGSLPISELRRRKPTVITNFIEIFERLIITYLRVKETKTNAAEQTSRIFLKRSLPISELRRRKLKRKCYLIIFKTSIITYLRVKETKTAVQFFNVVVKILRIITYLRVKETKTQALLEKRQCRQLDHYLSPS